MEKFKKYFKLPLKLDPTPYSSYAWTDDDNMALMFSDELGRKDAERLVNVINGIEEDSIDDLRFEGIDFFDGKNYIFCIRGWGNLIGIGANNLAEDKAAKIQDSFRDFIYNKLKTLE